MNRSPCLATDLLISMKNEGRLIIFLDIESNTAPNLSLIIDKMLRDLRVEEALEEFAGSVGK